MRELNHPNIDPVYFTSPDLNQMAPNSTKPKPIRAKSTQTTRVKRSQRIIVEIGTRKTKNVDKTV